MCENILDGVLNFFRPLADIPRPSGHEEAVSNYLKGVFKELGCSVVQDEVMNIIADLPASPGYEAAPVTILQGHMDMVCVAEAGVEYNPLTDGIKLRRTDEFLQAEGTSLGSDDGTGVAEILFIFSHVKEHGPLRAVITVDEEVGMKGAGALSADYLADARYLINCDSEDYDVLTVGCAGSVNMDFVLPVGGNDIAESGQCWRFEIKNLKGGHSGERIGDGRANAIKILIKFIAELHNRGMLKAVGNISGGVARNAIPSEAMAEFFADASKEDLLEIVELMRKDFKAVYNGIEDEPSFLLSEIEDGSPVIGLNKIEAVIQLVTLLHSGVFAMSALDNTLVETSANIGMLRLEDNKLTITYFPRSSIKEKLYAIAGQGEILAKLTGFKLQCGNYSPAWHENCNSSLTKMMKEIFEEQNSIPMKVMSIHAGLECGYHIEKNPELDMVSVGVTTRDIHSPRERLVLATVEPQVKLIEETLRRIAAEKR